MEDSFGARLRKIRKENGLTQEEFGKRLGGITALTVHRLEKRDHYHDELITKMMEKFGVDPRWLLTGESREVAPAGIPVVDSLGGADAEPAVIGRLDLAGLPEQGRAVRITGDDMVPTVRNGDFVVFLDGEPEEGDVILYCHEWGDARARRFSAREGGLLIAEAPGCPPIPVDEVKVVGRVVQVIRHTILDERK